MEAPFLGRPTEKQKLNGARVMWEIGLNDLDTSNLFFKADYHTRPSSFLEARKIELMLYALILPLLYSLQESYGY